MREIKLRTLQEIWDLYKKENLPTPYKVIYYASWLSEETCTCYIKGKRGDGLFDVDMSNLGDQKFDESHEYARRSPTEKQWYIQERRIKQSTDASSDEIELQEFLIFTEGGIISLSQDSENSNKSGIIHENPELLKEP